MSSVQWIGQDIAVLTRSGAVVTASGINPFVVEKAHPSEQILEPSKYPSQIRLAPWGPNNLYPLWLLSLLRDSNIGPQLIATSVSLAMGQLYTYRWEVDPETGAEKKVPYAADPAFRRMMRGPAMTALLRSRATDFLIFGNTFARVLATRDGQQIAGFQHIDASTCRVGVQEADTKQVTEYYICSDWRRPRYDQQSSTFNVEIVPAWFMGNPLKYYQSVLHSKLYWPGQPYYGVQPWHSGHGWFTYANRMPVWMAANINKAANIKYHIQYPADYFSYLDNLPEDERKAKKEAVFAHIERMIEGAEKAQSTFFTSVKTDPITGQSMTGWTITAIPNDLKDDAFLPAFFASIQASTSAMGVDPSLANIQMEGRMPPSGSDKRISYQIHEVMKTREVREVMLAPLYAMRDLNGMDPDMEFDFTVRNIVTLAEDAGGTTPSITDL